jgi:hypothetical protein
MSNIIWKSFLFSDLFTLDSSYNTKQNNKELDISPYKTDTHSLLLINKGGKNNAEEGYIVHLKQYKTLNKGLTLDDQFGNCFYHDSEFIMTGGGHINVVLLNNLLLKKICDEHPNIYLFLSIIIRKIFKKNGIYGYNYKITEERPNREIILLPLIQIEKDEETIWIINSKRYTIAHNYIELLIKKAKTTRNLLLSREINNHNNNINNEINNLNSELAKFEEGYRLETKLIKWKSFKLSDLFIRSNDHVIKASKKNLDESSQLTHYYRIRNITASKENKGCSGYLADEGEVTLKKHINMLTIASDAAYGGVCFFQNEWFVSTGHNNLLSIINPKLIEKLNQTFYTYEFLAAVLTKTMHSDKINRFMRPIGADFDREIILLPLIQAASKDPHIWTIDDKKWNLAINTMAYIYLKGKISYKYSLLKKETD